jgi:hypothetical protein
MPPTLLHLEPWHHHPYPGQCKSTHPHQLVHATVPVASADLFCQITGFRTSFRQLCGAWKTKYIYIYFFFFEIWSM